MSALYGLGIFRRLPENINELNPLLSSFQSFETSLELVALRRYPAAVITCANAWESAIKSYLKKGPGDEIGLSVLINEIFKEKVSLKKHKERAFEFRKVRNSLTHFGVSPGDDQRSFDLLLSSGYTFYSDLIRDCFGLYLNWRELVPNAKSFEEVGKAEARCVLNPVYGEALFESIALHKEFGFSKLINDNRFCAAKLSYKIGDLIRQDFDGARESFAGDFSDEYFDYLRSIREKVDKLYKGWSYNFNCPVCGRHDFVGEVDESRSTKKVIHIDRGMCIECGFHVDAGNKGVLNRLLDSQLKEKMPEIIKEFCGDL